MAYLQDFFVVELIGHYSNRDGLLQAPAKGPLAQRRGDSQPPRRGRLLKAITEVLELAGEPVKVSTVHAAVEEALGHSVAYRSIKDTLSDHARGRSRRFERVSRGRYGLTSSKAARAG